MSFRLGLAIKHKSRHDISPVLQIRQAKKHPKKTKRKIQKTKIIFLTWSIFRWGIPSGWRCGFILSGLGT